MKKSVGLMLVFVLMASFVVAGISLSEPLDIYNLGDRLYVSAEGLVGAETGNLNVDLVCGNRTVSLEKMSARRYDSGEAFPYSLPYKILNLEDLEVENLSDVVGECQVVLSLGASVSSTKTFTISDDVDVVAYLDKASYNPTEAITVSIDAVKDNGDLFNGFVEGGNATAFNKVIENGFIRQVFSMPDTIEAGVYYLTIRVYDGKISPLNEGAVVVPIVINQVASSIILSLSSDVATPGDDFSVGAEVFDQSGIKMEGTVSIKFVSTLGEEIGVSVQSGEFVDVNFISNASVGMWRIISSFNNLTSEREFEMLEVQAVEFAIEDGVLSVGNIGNVLYNKTITVQIGEEERVLDLNIDVGDIRKFALSAPKGEYDVVVEDGGSYLSRQILLTGKAVAIKDLKDVGIFKGYSLVWIILILVLGGVGSFLIIKYKRTKTLASGGGVVNGGGRVTGLVGKMTNGVKSGVTNSLHLTNKSPSVQGLDDGGYSHEDKSMIDLTQKKIGMAESTLVLKGEKQVSAVVSLSVKNYEKLSDVAKGALHKAVAGAQKKKGLIDWRGDYVFVVFSPIVTKTFKNEVLAVKIGKEIVDELSDYNKKFKDKIEFGIGVHVGELVASKSGEKLKYTSIGNTISLAKRISDLDSGKLIVSDEIRKKLLRDLKVSKGKEVGGNQSYEVVEVRDKSGDAERLADLLKRQG